MPDRMKKLMLFVALGTVLAGTAQAQLADKADLKLKLSEIQIQVRPNPKKRTSVDVRGDAVMGIKAFKTMQSPEMISLLSQMIDQTAAANPGLGQPAIHSMICFTGSSMKQMLNPFRKAQPMSCAMSIQFDANNPTLSSEEIVKRYSIDKTDDPELID